MALSPKRLLITSADKTAMGAAAWHSSPFVVAMHYRSGTPMGVKGSSLHGVGVVSRWQACDAWCVGPGRLRGEQQLGVWGSRRYRAVSRSLCCSGVGLFVVVGARSGTSAGDAVGSCIMARPLLVWLS